MRTRVNRREFIQTLGAATAGLCLRPGRMLASVAPTAPVAVARCTAYGPEVLSALAGSFDQLGGLQKLVQGKTVAVKMNLTGGPQGFSGLSSGQTYWVHPQVVGSLVHLLGKAGARRIRLLESPTANPVKTLQEFLAPARWPISDFISAASGVEFENTNYPGPTGNYARLSVPRGGMIFRAYDVSRAYSDCDVFVSLAKLKEHGTAGVTLSMKNLFGVPPTTIYGEGAGTDKPSEVARGARLMLHTGQRQPPRSAPAEIDPHSPRDPGYRVPRVTVDLAAARPIHLAVVDGIETVAGGEGPWLKGLRPVRPGLLIAGTNCVSTDAVATALMGFDPMAERGTAPFEKCDSTLRLAESLGIGTCDVKRIEVRGVPIVKAKFNFRAA